RGGVFGCAPAGGKRRQLPPSTATGPKGCSATEGKELARHYTSIGAIIGKEGEYGNRESGILSGRHRQADPAADGRRAHALPRSLEAQARRCLDSRSAASA